MFSLTGDLPSGRGLKGLSPEIQPVIFALLDLMAASRRPTSGCSEATPSGLAGSPHKGEIGKPQAIASLQELEAGRNGASSISPLVGEMPGRCPDRIDG
ncbi:hypothetical protein CO661_27550 [Sinorhizobium fredii]|uniref:Uncharacterized protein n=1 Tax=Rhizobium fredii TaxID=380 RepID=A0A2A6LQ32_RHIFR|nr:hypothetical protein CO661_27550 [Sinorhizobium fredii]